MKIKNAAFESKEPDRGYTVKASYLEPPDDLNALVEIFKDGAKIREFLFPAYKVWNVAAHFTDIVEGEIRNSMSGYEAAASTGFEGISER